MFTAKSNLALIKSDKGGYGNTESSFGYINLYQWASQLNVTLALRGEK
jgi:hypothetical protein